MPMPQDPPLWWRAALEAIAKVFIAVDLAVLEGKARISQSVHNLAGGARNITASALEGFARLWHPLLRVDSRSTSHTFLLAPGCDTISPDCIVRQCNTTEDLRAIMTIVSGPHAFSATTSHIDIDAWSFPVFYVYDPNFWFNYTGNIGENGNNVFGESNRSPHVGAIPVTRNLAMPSYNKALALFSDPTGADPGNGDSIRPMIQGGLICFVVFCLAYHCTLALGRYLFKKYRKADPNESAALEKAKEEVERWASDLELGYVASIQSIIKDLDKEHEALQHSNFERESIRSELQTCKLAKRTVESNMRKVTSDKETMENELRECRSHRDIAQSDLQRCQSDKAIVERQLQENVLARAEAVEELRISKAEVLEAGASQKEAELEVAAAQVEAKQTVYEAQQNAEKEAKLAKDAAEKEVASARKDADDRVESVRQESERDIESARQEAKEKFDSAQEKAKEKIDSAQEEANKRLESAQQETDKAAKLAHEAAEEKLKSVEKAAETKLDTTTAKYKQLEKGLQAELSTAKITIQELKPYKEDAVKQSEKAANFQSAFENERQEHRQYVNRLNEKHSAVLEELKKQHIDEDESRREQQEVAMQQQEEKHSQQVREMQGEIGRYVVVKLNLAAAEYAIREFEKTIESLRQQLSQLQDATKDYETLKTEKKELSSEKATLETQMLELRNDFQTKAQEFEQAKQSLETKLREIEDQQKTAKAQSEADRKSLLAERWVFEEQLKLATTEHQANHKVLQEKLQGVQARLKAATAQQQSTEVSLQAQVEQATNSVSRMEAASQELSQKVHRLQEQTNSQAETIMSKGKRICHLQNENRVLNELKEGVKTELQPMRVALEKAEQPNKEVEQDLEITAGEKKGKRRNRRKHRNGRYSTDRPDDTKYNESDTESEDLPAVQTAQQTVQQPLQSPVEEQVEEVREGLSNLAFDDDTATRDGGIVREAAKTNASASGSGSSDNRSSFRFLPDAASFVPAEARLAMPGFSKQSEASSTPTKPEITRAEGRTRTPTVVKEGITDLEWRSSPGSSSKIQINVSDTSTLAREAQEREEAHTASRIATPFEGLPKKDEGPGAKQDQQLVVNTSKISQSEAKKTDGSGPSS